MGENHHGDSGAAHGKGGSGELARVELVIAGSAKDLGGFQIRRALPTAKRRMVGPFIFFDHMGPVEFEIGRGIDVRPHPHIGLSTLTYLFEGTIIHRDTLGYEVPIEAGEVNWMTAGSGIAHSERSATAARARPQKLHGIQTWLALPQEFEEVSPAFDHHSRNEIPELSVGGATVRVVAGDFGGVRSPVRAFSEVTYLDVVIKRGEKLEFVRDGHDLAVYVVQGATRVGEAGGGGDAVDDGVLREGELGVMTTNSVVLIEGLADSRVLVIGGAPFREERFIWWNFVSSSRDRIERAKADWNNDVFGAIKGETERIPLPPV